MISRGIHPSKNKALAAAVQWSDRVVASSMWGVDGCASDISLLSKPARSASVPAGVVALKPLLPVDIEIGRNHARTSLTCDSHALIGISYVEK